MTRSEPPPPAATLRHIYVDQDQSMSELCRRYQVGNTAVRSWLVEAGIPIRTMRDTGRRRILTPPATDELQVLHEDEGLAPERIGELLGVSAETVRRWLRDAGMAPRTQPLKNRMRGHQRPCAPTDADTLVRLYVREERSLLDVSHQLGVSVHLVRTWMDEAGIARRPGGGRPGRPHPVRPWRVPPSLEELRRLRTDEALTLAALATRCGVHPVTARRWLVDAGLPTGRIPSALPEAPEEIVRLYQGGLAIAEIARRLSVPRKRVSRVLREVGVALDPARRIAAVKAGAERRRAEAALSRRDGRWAERRFVEDEWPMSKIAAGLGRSVPDVRRHLVSQGVELVRHAAPGRRDRLTARKQDLERLYVGQARSAEQVGSQLGLRPHVVLRSGHAHRLPIRPSGHPVLPAAVVLIRALYADPEIRTVLADHGVEPRPEGGELAERFPAAVPLTPGLVRDLYEQAGCSSTHIELLTGQSRVVVVERMRTWGIPLRQSHLSPALIRFRRASRRVLLDAVVDEYRLTGSAGRVASTFGCNLNTVHRWLVEAGIDVPGRGRWDRGAPGRAQVG